jgi:hypothetical protein
MHLSASMAPDGREDGGLPVFVDFGTMLMPAKKARLAVATTPGKRAHTMHAAFPGLELMLAGTCHG